MNSLKLKGPSSLPTSFNAFVLTEIMVSTLIFSAVSLGLFLGFTSLERNFSATADFSVNHSDQMRISDYLALDLRRALAVQAASNDTTISIPTYYDAQGNPQEAMLDAKGDVYYGTHGSSTKFHYYLSAGTIYRQEDAKVPIALAENVHDFVFEVTDAGKVVSTRIVFNPTFKAKSGSTDGAAATAFYNTTLLRNTRSDNQIGVY